MSGVKAQAAMEYLMIMGIAMLMLVPLFSLVSSYTYRSKVDLRINSMQDSLQNLADSSDMVYSQGYPAKITTDFYIPEGIVSTNVTEHHFLARVQTDAGPTDLASHTGANLTGSLPDSPGSYSVEVQMTEGGVVNVTH